DRVVAGTRHEQPAVRGERHVVRPQADGEVAEAAILFEIDDAHAAAAPVADVEMFFVPAHEAGMRVLPDGDPRLEGERIRIQDEDLLIAFVANVEASCD